MYKNINYTLLFNKDIQFFMYTKTTNTLSLQFFQFDSSHFDAVLILTKIYIVGVNYVRHTATDSQKKGCVSVA